MTTISAGTGQVIPITAVRRRYAATVVCGRRQPSPRSSARLRHTHASGRHVQQRVEAPRQHGAPFKSAALAFRFMPSRTRLGAAC